MFRSLRMAFALAGMLLVGSANLRAADDVVSDDPFAGPAAPANQVAVAEPAARPPVLPVLMHERIRDALRAPTVMEFTETPLSDVVAYLKDFHKIDIQLDNKPLEDAGVDADTPLSRNLKDISLCSALRHMLGGLDLTFVIKDEVLLFTTRDKAASTMEVRLYDVHDLVTEPKHGFSMEKLQSLRDTIRSTIASDTWKAGGGLGNVEIFTRDGIAALVIRQSFDGHEQITELLGNLRKLHPHSE